MKEQILKLKEKIERYFEETEGLVITNIEVIGNTATLDFFESCGGGFASVGDFTIEGDELIKLAERVN